MTLRRRGDHGVTLVELLVAITMLSALVGAGASALVVSMRTSDASSTRMSGSAAAQLVARYFVPDAQSGVLLQGAGDTGCADGAADPPVLARFLLASAAPGGTTAAVTYALEGTDLVRTFCDYIAAPRRTVVGRDILAATIAAPAPDEAAGPTQLTISTEDGEWQIDGLTRSSRVAP